MSLAYPGTLGGAIGVGAYPPRHSAVLPSDEGADSDSVKGAPMADEVVRVQWLTNETRPRSEQRRFASSRLAAQFVMEELDEISRPTARMRVGSAELGLAGIERIYRAQQSAGK